jgi:arsenate reductase (thioredoxin)
MSVKKVLVMCTGNSYRSHMAHAYIAKFGGGKVDVYSCGVKPSGKVSQWAVKLMAEDGIDLSSHTSDHVSMYLDMEFDYLITVCDHANETCPIFPKPVKQRLHHSFADYGEKGNQSDAEFLATLRPTRDAIREWSKEFVEKNIF